MKYYFVFYLLLLQLGVQKLYAQNNKKLISPHLVIKNVVQHYFELNNNFSTQKDVWGNYTLDLTFEAMLFYDVLTKTDAYKRKVLDIMSLRNYKNTDTINYKSQPFCSINFSLFKATNDSTFIAPYLYETGEKIKKAEYSQEGAIFARHKNTRHILIDYMQEYTSRLARSGNLTNNTSYFTESVKQYEIYRKILRNPNTGLYSLGRGWLPDSMEISPGYWSRGHGWLIRGMVTTLQSLPKNTSHFLQLQQYLIELADALLKVQDNSGMWHVLLDLPNNSYKETSGTGMIAYYLAVAYKNGFISSDKYKKSSLKAANELRSQVNVNGSILNISPGPGPLRSIDNYIKKNGDIDDKHGVQSIIYGMLAEILLIE